MTYAVAEPDVRYRLAATAESKSEVVAELVAKHRGVPTLVIGQYVDQLDELAERLDAPLIKGDTTVRQREKLYESFRSGEIDLLIVSKVANFSIDLPTAQIAIQVSGAFGSRQEEAQRLGRILRPKGDGLSARFYAVVARDTVDAEFAQHRQRFLAEQGYAYRIMDAEDAVAPE
jgi:DNA excision repair protein ERCC-3